MGGQGGAGSHPEGAGADVRVGRGPHVPGASGPGGGARLLHDSALPH